MTKKEYFTGTIMSHRYEHYNRNELLTMNGNDVISYRAAVRPLLIGNAEINVKLKIMSRKCFERDLDDGNGKEVDIPDLWKGRFISTNVNIKVVKPNEKSFEKRLSSLKDMLESSQGDLKKITDYVSNMDDSELSAKMAFSVMKEKNPSTNQIKVLAMKLFDLAEKGIAYNYYEDVIRLAMSEGAEYEILKVGMKLAFIILSNRTDPKTEADLKYMPSASIQIRHCGNYGTVGIPEEVYNLAKRFLDSCAKSKNFDVNIFAKRLKRKLPNK